MFPFPCPWILPAILIGHWEHLDQMPNMRDRLTQPIPTSPSLRLPPLQFTLPEPTHHGFLLNGRIPHHRFQHLVPASLHPSSHRCHLLPPSSYHNDPLNIHFMAIGISCPLMPYSAYVAACSSALASAPGNDRTLPQTPTDGHDGSTDLTTLLSSAHRQTRYSTQQNVHLS